MPIKQRIAAFANHSVAVNSFHLAITRIVTFAAPLFALWHLLNVLSLDSYGVVAFGMAVIQLAGLLTDVGMTLAAIQKASIFRNKKRMLGRIMSGITGVKIVTSLFYSLGIITFALMTEQYIEFRSLFFLLPISVIFISLQPNWLFLGIEQSRVFTQAIIIGKVIYVISLFLLVRGPDDYMLAVVADALGNMAITTVSLFRAHRIGIPILVPTRRYISYAFKSGIGFFVSRIASASYQNANVIILGLFSSPTTVAIFSVAEQVYRALSQIFAPISLALYPYLTREKNRRLLVQIMIGTIVALILISLAEPLLAPLIFNLLDVARADQVQDILSILMVALFFQVLNMLTGYPLFAFFNRVDLANKTVLLGAVVYALIVVALAAFNQIRPELIAWSLAVTEAIVLIARLALWWQLNQDDDWRSAA